MKKAFLYIFILSSLLCFSIKRNVPSNYLTIQSALNACLTGDTVFVQPGTYPEKLYWPKVSNIKLFSAGDSSNTFIDANFTGRCLTIIDSSFSFIDTNTVIRGFKLKKGYSDTVSFVGVAIYAWGTKPMLQNIAVTNCSINAVNTATTAFLIGGIVFISPFSAIIKNCSFYNNTINNSTGNIYGGIISMAYNGSSTGSPYGHIYNTKFIKNKMNVQLLGGGNSIKGAMINGMVDLNKVSVTGNTITCLGSSVNSGLYGLVHLTGTQPNLKSLLISNNTFSCNSNVNVYSLGIYFLRSCSGNNFSLSNTTITDNKAITSGSVLALSCYIKGITCGGTNFMSADIKNCIFWNPFNVNANETNISGLVFLSVQNNILKKHYAPLPPTNYTVNPQFVSTSDFHLQLTSPGINSGIIDNTIPVSDLEFNSIATPSVSFPDIGCYEMSQPVNSLAISVNVSSSTVCAGSFVSFTNTTSNSKSCHWSLASSTNFGNANVFTLNTFTVGTYTVNVMITDSSNAIGTASYVITAYPKPTPVVTPSNSGICYGQSATLTAVSGNTVSSYLWFNGSSSTLVVVSPTTYTGYSLTAQNGYGCSATAYAYVNVFSLPVSPTINVSGPMLCKGQSTTLSAITGTGTSTYLWSNGSTTPSITVSPPLTTIYSLTVFASNSCSASSVNTSTITIFPLPNPTITVSSLTICAGQSVTLTVSTANSTNLYTWSTGAASPVIIVSPSVSATFTVDVKNSYGCSENATQNIFVYECVGLKKESVIETFIICPNPSEGLFFIYNPGGAQRYRIYDVSGKTLRKDFLLEGTNQFTLDEYQKGLYFLEINDNNKVYKLIVY